MEPQIPESVPKPSDTSPEAVDAAAGEKLLDDAVAYVAGIENPDEQADAVHSLTDKLKERGVVIDEDPAVDSTGTGHEHDTRLGARTGRTYAQVVRDASLAPAQREKALRLIRLRHHIQDSQKPDKDHADS